MAATFTYHVAQHRPRRHPLSPTATLSEIPCDVPGEDPRLNNTLTLFLPAPPLSPTISARPPARSQPTACSAPGLVEASVGHVARPHRRQSTSSRQPHHAGALHRRVFQPPLLSSDLTRHLRRWPRASSPTLGHDQQIIANLRETKQKTPAGLPEHKRARISASGRASGDSRLSRC